MPIAAINPSDPSYNYLVAKVEHQFKTLLRTVFLEMKFQECQTIIKKMNIINPCI